MINATLGAHWTAAFCLLEDETSSQQHRADKILRSKVVEIESRERRAAGWLLRDNSPGS